MLFIELIEAIIKGKAFEIKLLSYKISLMKLY
jgi:hypothetical protein